ncbi:AAA family ATPase [Azospirillum sp. ST 5-10]|uniref:AAA family ATPase n=1 Tax=unclassified Azospirillum TaxID=2630922 RepID=UPI003F4A3997
MSLDTSTNVVRPLPWLDFSDAMAQRDDDTSDAGELRAQLLGALPDLLHNILPNGTFHGHEFRVGSLQNERGASLAVELRGERAGQWIDHATGECGDIFDLWAGAHGLETKRDWPAVLDGIRQWLGNVGAPFRRPAPEPFIQDQMQRDPIIDNLGPKTGEWIYLDRDGAELGRVWRYEPIDEVTGERRKEYRPYDTRARRNQAPTLRPLYNIPGIMQSDLVILVEGEKCADAINEVGLVGTTAMMGAKSPPDKTNWSPLKGKRVIVWPDRDKAGWDYAEKVANAAIAAGANHVAILYPPDDMPHKWDAADALRPKKDEQGKQLSRPWTHREVREFVMRDAKRYELRRRTSLVALADWDASKVFVGKAPEQRFLVDGTFPMAVAGILAAMGDTGKGMMTLDLALKIAHGQPGSIPGTHPTAFGGEIKEFGPVVMFTAEDDQAEVHRRIERLDVLGKRQQGGRLYIIPMPNSGGPQPLVKITNNEPSETEFFKWARDQLLAIPDLKMVVFDPLSSFIHADVTSDPAAGSFATGLLASLATETGAFVCIPHHMRKPAGDKRIMGPEGARDAIRGTSALVDGVRMSYALWPAEESLARNILKGMDREFVRNAVHHGAVVKSNGPADRTVRTFVRDASGLLVDMTPLTKEDKVRVPMLLDLLYDAIVKAAANGHPFTHTGSAGLFQNRSRLPPDLRECSRHDLEDWCGLLLRNQRILKTRAKGQKGAPSWLDCPSGDFALGIGEVRPGAPAPEEAAEE